MIIPAFFSEMLRETQEQVCLEMENVEFGKAVEWKVKCLELTSTTGPIQLFGGALILISIVLAGLIYIKRKRSIGTRGRRFPEATRPALVKPTESFVFS